MGEFAFDLTDGTWSIDVSDDRLNVSAVDGLVASFLNTEVPSMIELIAEPDLIDVDMHVFLNWRTMERSRTEPWPHQPSASNQSTRAKTPFTSPSTTTANRASPVSPAPGGYDLVFNRTTPSDQNATDYDLVGEQFFDARIGLDAIDDPYEVALKNTYLVSGTLVNTTGDGIANDFLLYNEAEDDWFNLGSDENGSFAAYVPAGEWLIIVAPFNNANHTETLRQPLTVAADSIEPTSTWPPWSALTSPCNCWRRSPKAFFRT